MQFLRDNAPNKPCAGVDPIADLREHPSRTIRRRQYLDREIRCKFGVATWLRRRHSLCTIDRNVECLNGARIPEQRESSFGRHERGLIRHGVDTLGGMSRAADLRAAVVTRPSR